MKMEEDRGGGSATEDPAIGLLHLHRMQHTFIGGDEDEFVDLEELGMVGMLSEGELCMERHLGVARQLQEVESHARGWRN